jgi:hypothetical protein
VLRRTPCRECITQTCDVSSDHGPAVSYDMRFPAFFCGPSTNGDAPLHRVFKSRIVLDPTDFVKILLAAGADASLRNADGCIALDEAMRQQSKNAETYFPVRTIGPKKLEQTIEILRSRLSEAP